MYMYMLVIAIPALPPHLGAVWPARLVHRGRGRRRRHRRGRRRAPVAPRVRLVCVELRPLVRAPDVHVAVDVAPLVRAAGASLGARLACVEVDRVDGARFLAVMAARARRVVAHLVRLVRVGLGEHECLRAALARGLHRVAVAIKRVLDRTLIEAHVCRAPKALVRLGAADRLRLLVYRRALLHVAL